MNIDVNHPGPRGPSRPPWLLPAAIAAAIVLAAVLWDASRPGAPERSASWPASAGPSRPPGEGAVPSSASAESETLDAEDFEKVLDDFLAQPATPPMAQEFRREFMAQPPLRDLFDRYRRDQRARPSPANFDRFAHAVVSRAEFRHLLSRFMQDPGFRQTAQRFAQLPLVRPVLGASEARAAAAGGRTVRANAFLGLSRPGGAISGVASSHFGTGGSPGGTDAEGTVSAATYVSSAAAGQQDGYGVTADMKKTADAGKGVDSRNPLASLCFQPNSPITPQQCKAIDDNLPGTDIWGACYKSGNYDACKQLCDQGVIPCSNVPSYYDACMSATNDTAGCAAGCQERGDCPASSTNSGSASGSSQEQACMARSDPSKQISCVWLASHCCCYNDQTGAVSAGACGR